MFEHERSLVTKYENRPFALLGVNVDPTIEKLRETQKKYHLNWRSWWDGQGGPIVVRWRVEGLPTLYLLDSRGKIRWKSEGESQPQRTGRGYRKARQGSGKREVGGQQTVGVKASEPAA